MKREVRLEVIYLFPPDRVWSALTDSRVLARWLMPNDFQPQLGHRFHFMGKHGGTVLETIECEVIELQPPHRLSYTWRSSTDQVLSVVTWVLEPVAEGTRLRMEHREAHGATTAAEAWEDRLVRFRTEISQAARSPIGSRGRVGRGTWRPSSNSSGAPGSWRRSLAFRDPLHCVGKRSRSGAGVGRIVEEVASCPRRS
jgi:uncharacterized protein YndB with AHSA1/START domain